MSIVVYTQKCHALLIFCQILQGVNMNYQAKFGGPSLKIYLVLSILVYTHKYHAL